MITCCLYVNIILKDYVRTILNLNATASEWTLDPREDPAKMYGPSGIPEAIGNSVSVEFNLIYRWHSAISVKDEQWTVDFMQEQGVDPTRATPDQFREALINFIVKTSKEDPGDRVFGGLTRTESGAFQDKDLIKLLTEATEDHAGEDTGVTIILTITDAK